MKIHMKNTERSNNVLNSTPRLSPWHCSFYPWHALQYRNSAWKIPKIQYWSPLRVSCGPWISLNTHISRFCDILIDKRSHYSQMKIFTKTLNFFRGTSNTLSCRVSVLKSVSRIKTAVSRALNEVWNWNPGKCETWVTHDSDFLSSSWWRDKRKKLKTDRGK